MIAVRKFANARWVVPAIFVLAIGLRLLFALLLPQTPHSDGAFYSARAAELAAGLGYQEGGHPTAFWPVGYPAALAGAHILFGPGMAAAVMLNLIASAAILALLLWFGRAVVGDELAARAAAVLYAIYPAHIAYAGAPLSETVSTAVAIAAFALLIAKRHDRRWLLLAGALFGLATLMRPQMMLFPAGALVALVLACRDFALAHALRAALPVYLALCAVVLPWSFRNQQELGGFVLVSTNGGIGLYAGANDLATGDHMHVERTRLWDGVGVPREQWPQRQLEVDARLRGLALEWIADNPGRWLALGARKMLLVWRKDSDAFWGVAASHPDRPGLVTALQWANQLFYMALLALAAPAFAAAAIGFLRRDPPRARLLLLLCMPAFVTLLAFGFTGQVRYHYPAMPFVILAAGYTLSRLALGTSWARGRQPAFA